MLEVFLFFQGAPIGEKVVAFTLAVAMRKAATRMLGIDIAEVGCEVQWLPVQETGGYVISLYDAQPSGYVSSLAQRMPEVLLGTRQALDCPQRCESSCPACLLHFDARFRSADLDRSRALQLVGEGWVKDRHWHYPNLLLGPNTQVEHQPLVEAISRELALPDVQELRIFLNGDPGGWRIAQSGLESWVRRWCSADHLVGLVVSLGTLQVCDAENRSVLLALSAIPGVTLWAGFAQVARTKAQICAEVMTGRGSIYWAELEPRVSAPQEGWGQGQEAKLWRSLPQGPSRTELKACELDAAGGVD